MEGALIATRIQNRSYSECSPADGTNAAAVNLDFGTARWQLGDDIT